MCIRDSYITDDKATQFTRYVADITRNQLAGFDPLHCPVVLADDLGNLGFILF